MDLPEVAIFRPDSSPLQCRVTKTSPTRLSVNYVPNTVGVHLVQARFADGTHSEYSVNVSNPSAPKVIGGYDSQRMEFEPPLSVGVESVLSLLVAGAGPGELEADVSQGGRRRPVEIVQDTNER